MQGTSNVDSNSIRVFFELILSVGNGRIRKKIIDGEFGVKIPQDLLIHG